MKEKLRLMSESDLAMVRAWRNVPEVRKNMYTFHEISEEEHLAWWERVKNDPKTLTLIFEDEGSPAGFVSFTNYSGRDGSVTWAFYSGELSRSGVGRKMEHAALEYAFEELRVYRLECEVLEFNEAVINFHIGHGFKVDGVFRKAYRRGNERYSIYRLSMLENEWRKHVKPMLESELGITATFVGHGEKFQLKITPELVASFSDSVNDRNPIHLDEESAKQAGFAGRIAHGMLIGGIFSSYFANCFPGPGTIYLSQNLRFLSPVFVGESLTCEFRVMAHLGDKLSIRTLAKVDDRICVDGNAELLMPRDQVG